MEEFNYDNIITLLFHNFTLIQILSEGQAGQAWEP